MEVLYLCGIGQYTYLTIGGYVLLDQLISGRAVRMYGIMRGRATRIYGRMKGIATMVNCTMRGGPCWSMAS